MKELNESLYGDETEREIVNLSTITISLTVNDEKLLAMLRQSSDLRGVELKQLDRPDLKSTIEQIVSDDIVAENENEEGFYGAKITIDYHNKTKAVRKED